MDFILFNFIQFYLFNYFFLLFYTILFLKYFLIIMYKFTNEIHSSVFYRGDEINLLHTPQSLMEYVRRWITDGNTYGTYLSIYYREFEKKIIAYTTITDGNVPMKFFCRHISNGKFISFKSTYWLVLKSAYLSMFYIIILHLKYQ